MQILQISFFDVLNIYQLQIIKVVFDSKCQTGIQDVFSVRISVSNSAPSCVFMSSDIQSVSQRQEPRGEFVKISVHLFIYSLKMETFQKLN